MSTGRDGQPGNGRPRPTKPGETRLWCSCDPHREHPFLSSRELVEHVIQAREAHADLSCAPGHGTNAALAAGSAR
jgi:hypothetical protein